MPELVTFGCRLNLYESEAMRKLAGEAGIEDVVIVNTCAVTGEAERQARQAIRRLRRERPEALIVVTGCAAQRAPEKYAAMDEVDFVLGNEVKMKEEVWAGLARDKGKIILTDISRTREAPAPVVSGFPENLTRGFVPVQNGCDHDCTFCAVHAARGPSRSVAFDTIVAQTRVLLENNYPEITLTGVDIASYGHDVPGQPTLGQLAKRLLAQVPELKRLRLSSLDPAGIDEDLWRLIENEPRLMPHVHLSLQAGDDLILKRMKRRHTRGDVEKLVARARAARPDIAFGADVIAGFPTEDEAMFVHTCALLEDCGIAWLHVFPYSARQGTSAARMPQVPMPVRKQRAARLREIGAKNAAAHVDTLIGRRIEVHVEQPLIARAPSFAEVTLLSPERDGRVILAEGVRREGEKLVARTVRRDDGFLTGIEDGTEFRG